MDGEGWMDWLKEPRGVKRPPEDDLDSEQRLAKRLSLLDLGRNAGLNSPTPEQSSSDGRKASTIDEAMQLDDTKHKVYIHSLEEELAESESQDDRLIFLPDIEKRMTRIPQSILKSPRQTTAVPPPTNTEVVLYNVPSSLSVPKEYDNVRKVIIEARARARERQAQEMQNGVTTPSPLVNGTNDSNNTFGASPDGFGTNPPSGVGALNSRSTPSPRVNNTTAGRNTFATPIQTPLTSGFTNMPLNTSPHIPVTTTANNLIFNPLLNQTPLMNEYSVKPFTNGFSTIPVDIHQKIVVVEDPDAMDIE